MKKFISHSPEETEQFAAQFSLGLQGGEVIAYRGSMGMGKTTFTRGLVHGLGADNIVSSPTFALVNEYDTPRLTVYHFDMYRITSWDDLYSTGFFDYLDTGAVLLIEWSENIEGALPDSTIIVELSQGENDDERIITIEDLA
ncbi:MAG: tRNA (adenosine(37)-N6)-threonylcarbamoyltransferase complex ATPase subunit type 1 TsaE [Clostridia bacterium]|nr:tRNA (adenosine(37)-N6)-threonylcarbamoyltransferase complex ATPase subunit type 1 TsaE [Clostridia bacterium]